MRQRTILICVLGALTAGLVEGPAQAQDMLSMDAERMIAERQLGPIVHQAVRFMSLVRTDKLDDAGRLFAMSQSVREQVQSQTMSGPLSRVDFEPPFHIELVGFQPFSRQVVELLYVATTEAGPVAVRLRVYQHERQIRLAGMDVTDDWDAISAMLDNVIRLPASLVISASPRASELPEPSGTMGESLPGEARPSLGSKPEADSGASRDAPASRPAPEAAEQREADKNPPTDS